MGIPDIDTENFPRARRDQTRAVLLETMTAEIRKPEKKKRKRHTGLIVLAGLVAAGTTAGAFYVASQSVPDQTIIRCFYSQDLNEPNSMGFAQLPSEDRGSAVERSAEQWYEGTLTENGINPAFGDPNSGFNPDDPNGPKYPIPELTACVYKGTAAVIPGGPDICQRLGIPKLEP
jgi:hypothetical protein